MEIYYVRACVCFCEWLGLILWFVPTSELRGCMSNSVELCPMPLGMPAVLYMVPTVRFFLASLATFISSTVTPSSAKLCTPALAAVPSSHSWKWRLWLTAEGREETQGREEDRSKMLIDWNAYQCHWSTTEPRPDGEIISTTEPVCISMAASYFLHLNRKCWRNCPHTRLWNHCMVIVFLHLSLIKPQHRLQLTADGSGSQSWQQDTGQKK